MPDFNKILGTGITLTNNETKDMIKIIKSLENSSFLWKGTARKIATQEVRFPNLFRPLMKSVLTPLAKSVLVQLELTAAALATDAPTHKKILISGSTPLIFSNKNLNYIMKIVKSLEEPG